MTAALDTARQMVWSAAEDPRLDSPRAMALMLEAMLTFLDQRSGTPVPAAPAPAPRKTAAPLLAAFDAPLRRREPMTAPIGEMNFTFVRDELGRFVRASTEFYDVDFVRDQPGGRTNELYFSFRTGEHARMEVVRDDLGRAVSARFRLLTEERGVG